MRNILAVFILFTLLLNCADPPKHLPAKPHYVIKPEFQNILDSAKVQGAILIYDLAQQTYYTNDMDWVQTGELPASTFKITNSIIGLELGLLESDTTVFKWDGTERPMKVWEQDLTLQKAFQLSCVPCYQELARSIGPERMNHYLHTLGYGQMVVDSSNIDLFWLAGDSKISQMQQIDFLTRLHLSKLPIQPRTAQLMKKIMLIEENEDYRLSGKTGWAISGEKDIGWFAGFLETKGQIYFFATRIQPQPALEMNDFAMIRKEVSMKAFRQLAIISGH